MKNFFKGLDGQMMSIQAAVTRGLIYRGSKPGTIKVGDLTMTANAAIESGILDEEAAAYVASLAGCDTPAPHVRTDAAPPPAEVVNGPAPDVLQALAEFFKQPTALSKQLAIEAIEGCAV